MTHVTMSMDFGVGDAGGIVHYLDRKGVEDALSVLNSKIVVT